MGTDQVNADPERGLTKSAALATIRGILVSSLSRENLSPVDVEDISSPDQIESPPVAPSRRRRKVTFFDSKPSENSDNAGAAPVDSQRQTPRPASARQGSSNWSANEAVNEVYDGSAPLDQGKDLPSQRDREERLRIVKERQNDERQRKLEELKQQALAAQKFREQKEEERRRRLEELRNRDSDRRHQVEERKRQIWEAERDRREAILRKNQEREARIESKRKNERSSIVFAFGSSTPRMLEPADTGGSYWATRRATSTSNVMMLSMSAAPGPLTRRSSERELDGSKKRATSAGGIHRSNTEDGGGMSSSIYDVFQWDSSPKSSNTDIIPPLTILAETPKTGGDEGDGEGSGSGTPAAGTPSSRAARRKTDLMPTLPSPRDLTPGRGQSFRPTRSPGRAYSMSRLDILAQPRKLKIPTPPPPPHDESLSRSMTHLAQQPLRRADTSRSMSQLSAPPAPPPRLTRAERLRKKAREAGASRSPSAEQQSVSPGLRSGEVTPSRPQSSMSQHSVSSSIAMSTSVHSAVKTRPQAAPRRPRPYSIAVTGISSASPTEPTRQSLSSEHRKANTPNNTNTGGTEKPPIPKVHVAKKPLAPKPELPKKPTDKLTKSAKSSASTTPKATPLQSPGVEVASSELSTSTTDEETITTVTTVTTVTSGDVEGTVETVHSEKVEVTVVSPPAEESSEVEVKQEVIIETISKESNPVSHKDTQEALEPVNDTPECDMTASMLAKTRITTEEEAKAALAERRRLAREQAEREAELERQRIEAERLAEEERIRKEEEEQRRMEEEQLRLLEEARHAEEERLRQAIEETNRREEEEKRLREEEAKQKIEKEEAEKKAKEEAEKQRQEMEIRLKKEEEDRQARRKRVEAIMLRTRGKGTTPTNTPTKEDGDDSPSEDSKQETEHLSAEEKFLRSERSHTDANSTPITPKHNGHQNGVDNVIVEQNNVTNNLLDLSLENDGVSPLPSQPLPEQILLPTTTTPTNGKLANEDDVSFSTPPPSSPFIAFQDNKKQDTAVADLLS